MTEVNPPSMQGLADLKISAVVKVKSKINARILDSSLSKRHQILLA